MSRRVPYRVYVTTPQWRARADARLARAEGRCSMCRGRATQVHHLSYARACQIPPRERDLDLMPLCGWCHSSTGWWTTLLAGKPSRKHAVRWVTYVVWIGRRLTVLLRGRPLRVRRHWPFTSARILRWSLIGIFVIATVYQLERVSHG